MTVNKFLMPALVIVTLLGSVMVAKATGDWSVSGREMIDLRNLASGADVRGWMTLEQLSQGFDIPLADLYSNMAIPVEVKPDTALKDLEGILPDFEVNSVREAIDDLLDKSSPVQSSGEALREGSAALENSYQNQEQIVKPPRSSEGATEHSNDSDSSALLNGVRLAGSEIKGRHTLQEISEQCQVPVDELLPALGLNRDVALGSKIKDLTGQGKIGDIQDVRDIVTLLQKE
jgi:hypothetical protein